ncbi:hypothetical protein [Haloarcula pellucida]|uniref:Small CPxCG-related zinc finger protein n=1 Tax=Haloarcula pellucida TaxID=1427151 RepID=A0A830GPS6_9EURY|nr:hypothetical protein [Halomicroarcula pellucida]MBX0348998.1 hypothetical protein [Halomicroarcula pellucida]GGN98546.1 hypothetical protein GCM10009030_29020 [Halomicroarcula pellucida]
MTDARFDCDTCGRTVARAEADVSGTFGDLDGWHTLCCPHCGARLRTVFVGSEE